MPRASNDIPAFLLEGQQVLAAALDRVVPRCEQPPCDVHRSIRYTLLGPSKRVRGMLTMLVAQLFDVDEPGVEVMTPGQRALPAAAAVELVHASSLILDDLPAMDDTPVRRGRPANHVEFGEATAILAAVELLTLAFGHLASRYPPPLAAALSRLFADTIGSEGLIGGQAADLQLPAHPLRLAEIEPVDERKTAVLFRAAAAAGAMVAGAAESDVHLLSGFGDRIGLAFQIIDDILDGHAAAIADLSEAKRRAEELSREAIASLASYGERAAALRELARFVVERTE